MNFIPDTIRMAVTLMLYRSNGQTKSNHSVCVIYTKRKAADSIFGTVAFVVLFLIFGCHAAP